MMRRDRRSRKSRTSLSSRPRFSFEPLEPRLLLSHKGPCPGSPHCPGGGDEPPPPPPPPATEFSYSTYLGGSADEDDGDNPIAVDAAGNTYIAGYTSSADFPVTAGAFDTTHNGGNDAFVAKFDPAGALVYATFLGGNSSDRAQSIAVDSLGNAYVAGITSSNDFPTTMGGSLNGSNDVFVAKLDSTGAVLTYAKLIGGTGSEIGNAIALDADGNVYVAGGTDSTDFPTTAGAFDTSKSSAVFDAFVAKLNTTGTILYSTYLGGSADDNAHSVAVDSAGNAYVTGTTESTDFPTTAGAFNTIHNDGNGFDGRDAFVTKLSAAGDALEYSGLLGGRKWDDGTAITVDVLGSAYVAGQTKSNNFPTTFGALDTKFSSGSRDGFVTKISADGSTLVYSTFLGGSTDDSASGIALDPSGSGATYITGRTVSADFPTTPGAPDTTFNGGQFDAFVTKLNASGTALLGSTFLGGSDWDNGGSGIALDPFGTAHVTGWTRSTDFPTTAGAFQSTNNGPEDLFLTRLSFDDPAAMASAPAADAVLVLPPAPLDAGLDSSSGDNIVPDEEPVETDQPPAPPAGDATPPAQPVQQQPPQGTIPAELIDRALAGADDLLDNALLTELALALIE